MVFTTSSRTSSRTSSTTLRVRHTFYKHRTCEIISVSGNGRRLCKFVHGAFWKPFARCWVSSLLEVLAPASFQNCAPALHRLHHGCQDLLRGAHDSPPKASGELLWRLLLPRLETALLPAQTPVGAIPEPVIKRVEVRGTLWQKKDINTFGSFCILAKIGFATSATSRKSRGLYSATVLSSIPCLPVATPSPSLPPSLACDEESPTRPTPHTSQCSNPSVLSSNRFCPSRPFRPPSLPSILRIDCSTQPPLFLSLSLSLSSKYVCT